MIYNTTKSESQLFLQCSAIGAPNDSLKFSDKQLKDGGSGNPLPEPVQN